MWQCCVKNLRAVRPLFLELSCKRPAGRPDILTDFRVYSFFLLSTQKSSQHPYLQEPYLRSGTSVRAETFQLFSTQMYVSSLEKSAKSVRLNNTGRGLRAMPLSHLYFYRVRYQLQMLERISTVFVTEQPDRNLPFRVLSANQSTATRETDQSRRNYRTLPTIISPFDATLFLTQQNSS